jgi:NAD(P)-dependent dehydrogenase (short-subunit alcohol dehydrogenase family)
MNLTSPSAVVTIAELQERPSHSHFPDPGGKAVPDTPVASPRRDDVLLVTGGSRGIGAAIVRMAFHRGFRVCFTYREDAQAARSLLEELSATGSSVHAIQGDVADPSFAAACFDETTTTLGAVTSLVNNAGITGRIGQFADIPVDILRRTIDVNFFGTMLMAQEAVRRWLASGTPGRMVNISSIAATLGAPGEYIHYAASKAAVDAFTVGLGKEVASSGIRINAVAPGTALTGIHAAGGDPDRPARVAPRIPMGRVAQPDEIANAVLWLLSDEASYVNATVVRVSGGT